MTTPRHVLLVSSTHEILPFSLPMRKARREATVKARDDKNLEEGKFLLDKVWLDSA
jgi:hypothetical protein